MSEAIETLKAPELKKRTRVYVMRPREYEISGCSCGNDDPDWSEFVGHLWCDKCQKDFDPERDGLFGGPIGIEVCRLLGIRFDMFDLETKKIVTQEEIMAEAAALREAKVPTT